VANEERTEQATPRRRQDLREKGQVSKSIEVCATVGLLGSLLALKSFGAGMVERMMAISRDHIARAATFNMTVPTMQQEFLTVTLAVFSMLTPFLLVVMVVGLASNLLQVGFIFSTRSLQPDFARLNPLEGLKRMFSQRAAVDFLKSSMKALLIAYIVYAYFKDNAVEIIRLIQDDGMVLGPHIARLCWGLFIKATTVMVVIAGLDYMYQRWHYEKSIRMTKQEAKEEYKRGEGDPLIKSRIRQRAREIARQRMMSSVPGATLVVTNPTHYAVALRYEPGEMTAPVVVAKGQRLIAQRIKAIAREHGVPLVENKPLARALFEACDIGSAIPSELYQAVAEVIAFVFRKSGRGVR
jgi:flagellar biosynthetic protein FlhB